MTRAEIVGAVALAAAFLICLAGLIAQSGWAAQEAEACAARGGQLIGKPPRIVCVSREALR